MINTLVHEVFSLKRAKGHKDNFSKLLCENYSFLKLFSFHN